jgi:glycosyltransferase involved in cell wall biosynthesis
LLNDIFKGLKTNFIKKLIWYSHEDHPESLFDADRAAEIRGLLGTGKLEFRAGGTRTALSYKKFFGNESQILLQHYRLPFDEKYHRILKPEDFSEQIRVVLPGTLNDGRKGQMPVFYAFAEFLDRYYKPNPEKYRDFELIYVGLGHDFLSTQIEAHEDALEGRLKTHGRLSHAKNWDVVYAANCTICYSLREALPLFVFEGMITGHPVLRNDSSGMEEQLVDGENGFYLDSNDFRQLVSTIEKLMNRETTTDEMLAAMSAKSYEIAKKQALVSYKPLIDSAHEAFVRT